MDRVVSSVRLKTDPLARGIIDFLNEKVDELQLSDAILYYDFPIFRDYEEGAFKPSLLLLDKNRGIFLIRIAATAFDIRREDELLGDLHSLLYAKLLNSKRLRKSRSTLKVDINSFLYLAPGEDTQRPEIENKALSSFEGLLKAIEEGETAQLSDDEFAEVRSVIEGVKALTKAISRDFEDENIKPKALVIKKLDEEVNNFDAHQRRAALTVASGPQRIRGLAGSGKTVVLAWKAANIHLDNPEKKILFTFYTRSLYDTIRKQITRFYRHFKDADPNWDNLHILHAWGGQREAGVYYNAAVEHFVTPKALGSVRHLPAPFKSICHDLITKNQIREKYDVVLVDEAQDLPDSFFSLLFHLTKGARDEKSIIWAYDELQSIFEPRMRTPVELFGLDADGQPRVDLERSAQKVGLPEYFSNDLVLYKCYRNPLDVLVASHAVGLGIYGPQIVQMLQNKEHWEDVGYEVKEGDFTAGSDTLIERPISNSPLSILAHEQKAELVKHYSAPKFADEIDWIINEIRSFKDDGVKSEEILVICLDDRNAKTYFSAISSRLSDLSISSNDLLANPLAASNFAIDGRVTLSTVHRAKGNEAPLVIAVGVDALAYELGGRKGRNKLFTAFTRTKCWLRASGLAGPADQVFNEIDRALARSPQLAFKWPNVKQVETLQRDISRREEEARKLQKDYLKKMADLGYSEESALSNVPEKTL